MKGNKWSIKLRRQTGQGVQETEFIMTLQMPDVPEEDTPERTILDRLLFDLEYQANGAPHSAFDDLNNTGEAHPIRVWIEQEDA